RGGKASRSRTVCRPRADIRSAVTGPAPGSPRTGTSSPPAVARPAGRRSATEGELELVVAEMEDVALVDALVVDARALEVDPVGRPEVLDEVGTVAADDRAVLARDVAVLDRQVRRLRAAPDDELILVD